MPRWWPIMVVASLALAALDRPSWAAEKKAPAKKAATIKKQDAPKQAEADDKAAITWPAQCALDEAPAFGQRTLEGRSEFRYPRGPLVRCSSEPSKEVHAYPKLKSTQPLYGSLIVDGSPFDPAAGKRYVFVLDESVDGDQKPSSGARKYDRLWFDLNGDGDLTNDGVLGLAKESPFAGLPPTAVRSMAVFEDLNLPIDYGPPHGTRPFRIVPWVASVSRDRAAVVCFAPAVERRGTIRLGDRQYTAVLSQASLLSGRFDRPFVQLGLTPLAAKPGAKTAAPLLETDLLFGGSTIGSLPIRPGMLGEIRQVQGQYITVSATPLGDKLTIQPYSGEVGVLEVGPGGRAITRLGLAGTLVSKTGGSLAVGEPTPLSPELLPWRYRLPVGDYFASSLTVQYGRLRFNSRVLTDPAPPSGDRPKGPEFGLKIRKDEPFVLEFSGKPAVKFMTPTQEQSFQPGQQVMIRAMLTEPFQGIMVTGLYDTTQKKGEAKYRIGGKELIVPQFARLDPDIVIRDSQGKQVAEGKMPFG